MKSTLGTIITKQNLVTKVDFITLNGTVAPAVDADLSNITADAIAAIVAGRPTVGTIITKQNLVTKVDFITLNGTVAPAVDADLSYSNFFTANLVGGNHNADPDTDPGASVFEKAKGEYTDNDNNNTFSIGDATTASTDGFVATFNLGSNINFTRPEALLTVDSTGKSVFVD
jgi:hypothetical protein